MVLQRRAQVKNFFVLLTCTFALTNCELIYHEGIRPKLDEALKAVLPEPEPTHTIPKFYGISFAYKICEKLESCHAEIAGTNCAGIIMWLPNFTKELRINDKFGTLNELWESETAGNTTAKIDRAEIGSVNKVVSP